MKQRGTQRLGLWLFAAAILLAGVLAYANSFGAGFVFDDEDMIAQMRDHPLWPPAAALRGPRPVTDLTFAINYRLGGLDPTGFHLVNLVIHLAVGLALFGLIRRTLRSQALEDRFVPSAESIAFAVALLWTVHPLQTEAVTYVVQRAESLCGLLYLLTLYCSARGFLLARRRLWWHAGAVLACLAAMGAKPVAATAPLLVLLYDRTFFSGKFLPALKRSWALYAGLAACWAVFGLLLYGRQLGASAGFAVPNLTPWEYLRSQSGVILHYIRLAFWPVPLCLDYAWPVAKSWQAVVLPGLPVLALLAATGWAVVKNRPIGFAGVWFFGILSITSSVVPIADLCVERRMYLPLAAVILPAVLAARRLSRPLFAEEWTRRAALGLALVAAAGALGGLTADRNLDYRSPAAVWGDVVRQRPDHGRGWTNLSHGLFSEGRTDEAVAAARRALELDPTDAAAAVNLGRYLLAQGKNDEAMQMYLRARELNPNLSTAHYNIGNVYRVEGKFAEAVECYERAVELEPLSYMAWNNLGIALAQWRLDADGPPDCFTRAIDAFHRAIRLKPDYLLAWNSLGMALVRWQLEDNGPEENIARAEEAFRRALEIDPGYAPAKENLDKLMKVKARRAQPPAP